MADNNRDTETFALGIIIAAIIFLLLRKEFEKHGCGCGGSSGSSGGGNGAGGGANGGGGGGASANEICNCIKGCPSGGVNPPPTNPGVTLGASLSGWSFNPGSGGSPAPGSGIFGGYDYESSAASASIFA